MLSTNTVVAIINNATFNYWSLSENAKMWSST